VKDGYDRAVAMREVESLLSEEERAEIAEQERREIEGNIPRHDHLGELYGEFERISAERIADETAMIGILTAMREEEGPGEAFDRLTRQIRGSMEIIREQRKEILHDRETAAELKRVSG